MISQSHLSNTAAGLSPLTIRFFHVTTTYRRLMVLPMLALVNKIQSEWHLGVFLHLESWTSLNDHFWCEFKHHNTTRNLDHDLNRGTNLSPHPPPNLLPQKAYMPFSDNVLFRHEAYLRDKTDRTAHSNSF